MIIPVRCFTCGRVLANKWKMYLQRCEELRSQEAGTGEDEEEKTQDKGERETVQKKVLDELGIHELCCRVVMISTVDMCDQI